MESLQRKEDREQQYDDFCLNGLDSEFAEIIKEDLALKRAN